jgi:hypothetical protein
MKKSKISVSLLVLFSYNLAFSEARQGNIPTKEQVHKLVAAAWKEPIESIDITYYEDYTGVPVPIEQICKEVKDYYTKEDERFGRKKENFKPYELERRKKNIETNVKIRSEHQKFPRKIKKRLWVSGHNQRIDFVKVGPSEELGPNTPFVHTFINTKDANTGDFISFHYSHEMKTVFVDTTKWTKQTIVKFAGIPFASALQAFLGTNQGTAAEPIFVPDPNKIQELARTGLAKIEYIGEVKVKGDAVNRISISPDQNAPDTRDIIKIGDPNRFPLVVLTCDREDYSRVYRKEFHLPVTNRIIYLSQCSDFDSKGFPHKITEIKYDKDGSFIEKSVYRIEKVELNPVISDEVFEFNPPPGYKVKDSRTEK